MGQWDGETGRQEIRGLGLALRHVMNCKLSFLRKKMGDRVEEHRIPADWYLTMFLTLTILTTRILHRMRESTKFGP